MIHNEELERDEEVRAKSTQTEPIAEVRSNLVRGGGGFGEQQMRIGGANSHTHHIAVRGAGVAEPQCADEER